MTIFDFDIENLDQLGQKFSDDWNKILGMEEQEDAYGYVLHNCSADFNRSSLKRCLRCIGISTGTMPGEDGIYTGENSVEFMRHYVQIWDELEDAGRLRIDAEGMADNRIILRRVRYMLQQKLNGYEVYNG